MKHEPGVREFSRRLLERKRVGESPTENELFATRPPCKFDLYRMSASSEHTQQGLGPTIMSMLTSLLTLSMKTSLLVVSVESLPRHRMTHNSSRHRIGAPMAVSKVSRQTNELNSCEQGLPSHIESNKQMVEKDFSPPDNPFVSRPLARKALPSGSTCHSSLAWS